MPMHPRAVACALIACLAFAVAASPTALAQAAPALAEAIPAQVVARTLAPSARIEIASNPQGAFVAVQDAQGRVLERRDHLEPGEFVVTFSLHAHRSARARLTVGNLEAVWIAAPTLERSSVGLADRGSLSLGPTGLTGLTVLVLDPQGVAVSDVSALPEGIYTVVFRLRDHADLSVAATVWRGRVAAVAVPEQAAFTRVALGSLEPGSAGHAFQGSLSAATALGLNDLDCRDFTSQSEAQAYFDARGGSPSNNVDALDWNRNGVPCEVNETWALRSPRLPNPSIPATGPAPAPPTASPSSPSSPSKGMCWVNGYRRKDGTYVQGYWRRC